MSRKRQRELEQERLNKRAAAKRKQQCLAPVRRSSARHSVDVKQASDRSWQGD